MTGLAKMTSGVATAGVAVLVKMIPGGSEFKVEDWAVFAALTAVVVCTICLSASGCCIIYEWVAGRITLI